MAEFLASIHGTEKDKVNCPFYYKIGACRHGDRCSRTHNRPPFSQTVLLQNFYQNPKKLDGSGSVFEKDQEKKYFEDMYEDVFVELQEKYGDIEEMNICDNICGHLLGNIYCKFYDDEDADKAMADLNNRWFAGRPIHVELSPVTDFQEACCRQYEKNECDRGGTCNFMHVKQIPPDLADRLYGKKRLPSYLFNRRTAYESRDRDRDDRGDRGDRGDRSDRDRGGDRHRADRDRNRDRDRDRDRDRRHRR